MTDFRIEDPYEASYPPSVWGGGGGPPATNVFPSAVTAGTPGSFSNPLSPPATLDSPDDLAELQALGALGATAAWATGEYVDLEGGSTASWDGTAWIAGAAADEPDDGEDPDEIIIVPDPGTMTVAEVKAWVDALPHNGHGHDAVQQIIELERAGQNRTTLVDWLDQKLGVI